MKKRVLTERELVLLQASLLGYEAQDLKGNPLTLEEVGHYPHFNSTIKEDASQLGSWWFDVFEISNSNWQVIGHIAVSPITSMDEYKYPAAHKV